MTGSSASFTCMRSLLLLSFLISFVHLSVPRPSCRGKGEFRSSVDKLGETLQNCADNCSSAHITDIKCKCFNLSSLQGENFPGYFINGLNALHPSISDQARVNDMVKLLQGLHSHCLEKLNFTVLRENYEPFISPKRLHKKLENLSQQIYTFLG